MRIRGVLFLALGLLVSCGMAVPGQAQFNGQATAQVNGIAGSLAFGTAFTGSPYCATAESESTQTLADGTHISRKSKTHTCRDSQGRTRTETFRIDPQGNPSQDATNVSILDPVDGVQYFLDARGHTAHRLVIPQRPSQIPQSPSNPAPARVSAPPPNRPEVTKESLGSQTIEGVLTDGTRTTVTYAAGTIGNDRPVVSVTEAWFSQQLGLTILSKRSDPRTGETVDQLTDIDTSEPDPTLFRVPADYTISGPGPLR